MNIIIKQILITIVISTILTGLQYLNNRSIAQNTINYKYYLKQFTINFIVLNITFYVGYKFYNEMENKTFESIPAITIRFAGDSGDGMQLVGTRFTDTSAIFGNDLATLPAFPAEIRAPQGTIAGVSSFQVQIADFDILTPGDNPDVLVAMNPAALKAHLHDLAPNGMLILNEDAFEEKNITKAGYKVDPRESGELDGYRVFGVPMEKLTKEALEEFDLPGRAVLRSKNMIALGLISWTFNRPLEDTENWINDKFSKLPDIAKANIKALKTGYNFGITVEAFHHTYVVEKASLPPGEYTNINGNIGLSWGLIAAAKKADLDLFYGSYPITPASDILHELSKHKNFNVITFQAEDEIAAAAASVGASFTGKLAVTGTSGPGLALKSETISLALSAELPLVIVNVQRGGPSTGLPTKPEQSDLMFALYGRHGESPLPVVAAKSPSHAFYAAYEASRLALKYMTPVILLSDNYVATGSEPWNLPDIETLNKLKDKGVTSFAMELMPRITRAQSMDILSSQSNLAGYKAVIDATYLFNKAMPMMMTAAGTIAPAKVMVFGAGVAGLQAIATAKRLGAIVSATDS